MVRADKAFKLIPLSSLKIPLCAHFEYLKRRLREMSRITIPAFHDPPFVRFHIANQPRSGDLACSIINLALMSNVVLNFS